MRYHQSDSILNLFVINFSETLSRFESGPIKDILMSDFLKIYLSGEIRIKLRKIVL